jgi:hypothetical protein
MAARQIKRPAKDNSETEIEEVSSQRIFSAGGSTNKEFLHDTGNRAGGSAGY